MTSYKPPQNTGDFRTDKWREAVARFAEGEHYDTNERATGRVWVDGSPLYTKTVSVGALPNATVINTLHNILGLGDIILLHGWARNGSNRIPIPYIGTTTTDYVSVFCTNTQIRITTGIDWSSYSGYVTLEYTKT